MDRANKGQDPFFKKLLEFLGPQGVSRSAGGLANVWLGTNVGHVRKDNQDRVAIVRVSFERTPRDNFTLAILADGIGGLANGAEAATVAISSFVASLVRNARPLTSEQLINAAQSANAVLFDLYSGRAGSTLSAVLVSSAGCMGVNVGDSRIFGQDSENRLTQLSADDTMGNYLNFSDSIREGRNALLQYIGMGEGVEPHQIYIDTNKHNKVIITSDGIHGIGSGIFDQVVRSATSSQELVRKLLTLNDISGGNDNGSVVTIPTNFTPEETDGDGMSVRIFAPSDRLEIWIPRTEERSLSAYADQRYETLKEKYDSLLRSTEKPKKKPVKRKTLPTKTGTEETSPPLPLDEEAPAVNISFPKTRE